MQPVFPQVFGFILMMVGAFLTTNHWVMSLTLAQEKMHVCSKEAKPLLTVISKLSSRCRQSHAKLQSRPEDYVFQHGAAYHWILLDVRIPRVCNAKSRNI